MQCSSDFTAEKKMRRDVFFDISSLWWEDNPCDIMREDIHEMDPFLEPQGKVCFLLHNVLSPRECKYHIPSTQGTMPISKIPH